MHTRLPSMHLALGGRHLCLGGPAGHVRDRGGACGGGEPTGARFATGARRHADPDPADAAGADAAGSDA